MTYFYTDTYIHTDGLTVYHARHKSRIERLYIPSDLASKSRWHKLNVQHTEEVAAYLEFHRGYGKGFYMLVPLYRAIEPNKSLSQIERLYEKAK